jgi:drug/metabolite transporter (DMT)-like permease
VLAANLGLVLTVIAWGSTAPILNELLKTWDPVVLSTGRFMLSSVIFLIWLRIAEGRIAFPRGELLHQTLWIGGILVVFVTLLTFAINYSNPINISIISASAPIAASFVNRFLTGKNPPRAILFSIPVVVAGGVFSGVDMDAFGQGASVFQFQPGDAIMLVATALWATYSALLQRWFGDTSQLHRTTLSFVSATPMIIVVCAVLMGVGVESLPAQMPDAKGWGFLIWTSLATSILGTYCWNVGVKHLGIVVGTMFLNLIPMVAIAVSIWFGIEPRTEQLMGGILVIIGVASAQYWSLRVQRTAKEST